MADDDSIWHATNIDIYDYVTALKRLEFSADSTLVKNPNGIPLWLSVNGATVQLLPGELKNIR